jgi:phthalate 3,4-dioxygenase ferredoxin reductase subunit
MSTVVVGSSVAGIRAAQAIRRLGYPEPILVIGEDIDIPYDKPPLSKAFLSGALDEERIRLITPDAAAQAGIELRLGTRATALDPQARQVELASGERIGYDHVLLATGASARPSPWTNPGVHVLRTLADSRRIAAELRPGATMVVVGGGFIGAEVASTARALGVSVTIVDPVQIPMARVLGDNVGAMFGALHERNGVQVRFGVGVEDIDGEQGALRVQFSDGSTLPADLVVVGIGAVPNVEWLASSGLRIADGVVCDSYCRAVGADGVYAIGDVARWFHPRHGEYLRVEHWTNAVEQAQAVACNIVGPDRQEYAPVEYVWTDQHDWKVQIAGRPTKAVEQLRVEAGEGERSATLYADADGVLVGTVTVNWPRAMMESRKILVAAGSLGDAHDRLKML